MTNSMTLYPEPLLDPDRLEEWIIFTRNLPIPPTRKKQLCIDYAKMRNLSKVATKDLVESVIGEKRR